VFVIGIDPHKGSHTAAVINGDEELVGELSLCADGRQRDRLLRWAAPFEPRLWAVEGATGHGALLAQQLVASGETVVDVPAALSARARLLDAGHKDKTDAHDARSAAIVALRNRNVRAVTREDHRQILRLLARRHHQLVAARTRAICRLHAVLAEMIEGGLSKKLSAKRASIELNKIRPHDSIGIERKRIAAEFVDEVRRIDLALVELHRRINTAVKAADTLVTDVFGVGPIVACYLIGYSGNMHRFPSAGHYARYNATAPIEASSGPKRRHRLNPNGSTPTATANSTTPSTSPRSDRSATTPPAAPTTSRNWPTGKAAKKRCAASNAASATPSTDNSASTSTTDRTGPGGQPGTTLNPAWPANP